MTHRIGEGLVVGVGLAYLVVLSWAIGAISYDIWGALVVGPIYGALGVVAVGRLFRDAPPAVITAMGLGLAVKLGGALVRYWVGFEAYEGGIDAGEYSRVAADLTDRIWDGSLSVATLLPREVGTQVVERFTAAVYMVTGTSTLAGFLTFSLLAYLGLALMVKAALVAVPDLQARKYAWICVLLPSLVYWPSSIGKEALVLLGLGIATFGAAQVYAQGVRIGWVLVTVAGIGATGVVRPHMAGIWAAAVLAGVVVLFLRPAGGTVRGREVRRGTSFTLLVLGGVGLAFLAAATVSYLKPGNEESQETSAITLILEETQRRTAQAESAFDPPSVSNPVNWPFAAVRTITRPLPGEVTGVAQWLSALEMVAVLGLLALSWRSVASLPRLVMTNAYVTFAVVAVFLTGLAYSSFANLGVLTRQKSLVLPLVLLLACLPEWRSTRAERIQDRRSERLARPPVSATGWTRAT
jgi:hypothetical protein